MSLLTEKNQYLYTGLAQFSLFGISHNELSSGVRGAYSLSTIQQEELIKKFKTLKADNILLISTCNRTEVYARTNQLEMLAKTYTEVLNVSFEGFQKSCYRKQGLAAVKHLFEVSAGMRSQILGDFEIIGQVRKAFRFSKNHECAGAFLERLVNSATQMSKRIKNETQFSSGITSTSYAAVNCVLTNFSDHSTTKVGIYGLGKIGRNVCENLVKHFPQKNVRVLNRSIEKAQRITSKYNIDVYGEEYLEESLMHTDALIVATGSSEPTVLPEMIPTDRQLFIIDLSIPKNVHPAISHLPNCQVLGVDEISEINTQTMEDRNSQLPLVKEILQEDLNKFIDWMESRKHASAIQAIKGNFQDFQKKELLKAKKNPEDSEVKKELEISNKVINRITGQIFSQLKNLDENELDTVYKLFSLDKNKLSEQTD